MKKLLLALLGVLVALPTLARDFKYTYEGQTLTYTVIDEDAKTCMTKDGYFNPGNEVSGELVIPEIAKDGDTEYSVISIGDFAFYRCSLTSVDIPNSITSIGYDAFYNCYLLTQLTIPDSVTSIGEYAFRDCSGLSLLTIPNSVTSIGWGAFSGCSGLTQVIIPNSVTYIGNSAFDGCRGLKKSAYPNTLKNNPFSYGVAVAYNPDGAVIEDYWIYGPDKSEIRFAPYTLEGEYIIPETVTSIGNMAFDGCSGLTQLTLGNSVTSIGDFAFYKCSGLTQLTIPDSVTSIGWGAFSGCSGLTLLTIGNSVTSIGDYAFSDCSGLTQVIIGNSVKSIGDKAFNVCLGLKKSAYPNTLKNNPFSYGKAVAYNPDGAVIEDYWIYGPDKSEIRFAPYTLEGECTIPETVTSIGDYAFQGCNGLTQVKVLTDLPPQMFGSAFDGLYETVNLEVPAGAVYNYMLTVWANFKNIYREGSDETLAATYKKLFKNKSE